MKPRTTTYRIVGLAVAGLACALAATGCTAKVPEAVGPTPSVTATAPVQGPTSPANPAPRPSNDVTPTPGSLSFGQSADYGDLKITVTGTSIGPKWEGKPTFTFTVTYENTGSNGRQYDENDWVLVSSNGTRTTKKAALEQKSIGSGTIDPGAKVTGLVHFSCPGLVRKIIFEPAGQKSTIWIAN